MQSDWGSTQAIELESGSASNEQPDWLKNAPSETTYPSLSQPPLGSAQDIPDLLPMLSLPLTIYPLLPPRKPAMITSRTFYVRRAGVNLPAHSMKAN